MFIYIFNTTLNALACFYCSRNCDLDIAKASWHAIYRIHDRQILQNFQLKKKLQKIETFSIKNISMDWYKILSEMKCTKQFLLVRSREVSYHLSKRKILSLAVINRYLWFVHIRFVISWFGYKINYCNILLCCCKAFWYIITVNDFTSLQK